jgi:uroporphyrinogen decarboxylase
VSSSRQIGSQVSPRERVRTALRHTDPDRVPADFLATPEIWERLVERLELDTQAVGESAYCDPTWEAVLRHFEVDCRIISYDQFCAPPSSVLHEEATVDWWGALNRSTPNRMWRQRTPSGEYYDIWGHHLRIVPNPSGAYEEYASWPLSKAMSVDEVKNHPWPEPSWWDFSPLPQLLAWLDQGEQCHVRFRVGSVFEIAWQLRGMQELLMDLALDPGISLYIMDRLAEVYTEITRQVLEIAGERLDMVYFYDDIATQHSLMISPDLWRKHLRPRHEQIIEVAKAYDKPVMYHSDGSVYPLIPELIDMGVDLLNPIQPDAKDMEPQRLKGEFGDRLSFHGGIDIVKTLPYGTVKDVQAEVQQRVDVLGKGGGYVLAGSHHIQPDTPVDNVLAMYDLELRYRSDE